MSLPTAKMIHRNDERVFRVIELTCYVAMFLSPLAARIGRVQGRPYFWPVLFVGIGAGGLAILTRFFIYAHPENVGDRTRAEFISLSQKTKLSLLAGYAMCVPMFILGCVGLFSLPVFERTITAISPIRFPIGGGSAMMVASVVLLMLAGAAIFVGITRSLPRIVWLGILIVATAIVCGLVAIR